LRNSTRINNKIDAKNDTKTKLNKWISGVPKSKSDTRNNSTDSIKKLKYPIPNKAKITDNQNGI
jgi:hypothetical protein